MPLSFHGLKERYGGHTPEKDYFQNSNLSCITLHLFICVTERTLTLGTVKSNAKLVPKILK